MVLHAGVYYFTGPVVFYNTVTKEIVEFEIEKKIWRIPDAHEIFNLIKMETAEEELGCCCICVSNVKSNDQRQSLINIALNIGFKKVRIIDGYTAFYLSVISQINYKPENDDIIWLYSGAKWYIWFIENNKATMISIINVKYSKTDLNVDLEKIGLSRIPHVILYNDSREFDEKVMKEMFQNCLCFSYKQGNYLGRRFESMQTYIYPEYCISALVKARVMGKDPDAMKYNANPVYMKEIRAYISNNKNILLLKEGQKLTAKKSATFKTYENYNILKVVASGCNKSYVYCLPINKYYTLSLTLEKNGIFDIILAKHQKQPNIVQKSIYFFPITATIPFNSHQAYIVGVNLGNTRCCAATIRRNGIEAVALDNMGERLLPCYIGYDENHDKCGAVVIKRLFEQLARETPQISTVFDIKRIIGKKITEINVSENWPFKIVQDSSTKPEHLDRYDIFQYGLLENNDVFIKMETKNGELLKHPEEVVAALLKLIKQKLDEFQGLEHSSIMITVPYSFSDSQKTSTCAAAVRAGWENVTLMPEPIAAAFSHIIKIPQSKTETTNLVIFDLGGKTLNVFVASYKLNEFKIISHVENYNLGGTDFNDVLVDHFSAILKKDHGIVDLSKKKHKLYLECLKIKEHLSDHEEDCLEVDEIFVAIEAFIDIKRTTFEDISKHLLDSIKLCVNEAIEKSSLNTAEINEIILIGGGTRMPMIKNMLKETFANATQLCGNNPDETMAIGAAHYANYLNTLESLNTNVEKGGFYFTKDFLSFDFSSSTR